MTLISWPVQRPKACNRSSSSSMPSEWRDGTHTTTFLSRPLTWITWAATTSLGLVAEQTSSMDEAFHFTTLTGSPASRRPLIRPQAGMVSAPWLSVSASQNAAHRDVSTNTSPNCSPGAVEPGTVSARVGRNNYGLFSSPDNRVGRNMVC